MFYLLWHPVVVHSIASQTVIDTSSSRTLCMKCQADGVAGYQQDTVVSVTLVADGPSPADGSAHYVFHTHVHVLPTVLTDNNSQPISSRRQIFRFQPHLWWKYEWIIFHQHRTHLEHCPVFYSRLARQVYASSSLRLDPPLSAVGRRSHWAERPHHSPVGQVYNLWHPHITRWDAPARLPNLQWLLHWTNKNR